MRKVLTVLALTLGCLGVTTQAAQAQALLLDYVGYDYEAPDIDPLVFGEVGSGYVGLGFVPVMFAPLVPDTVNNQYTYHMSGLTSVSRAVVGDFVIVTYSGPGVIRVYEDSKALGTDADYGINPPNATAPSSFSDGTLFLEGELTSFQMILNTVTDTGSFEAVFEAVGGSQLGNIPLNQREGWTFAGNTGNELNRPEGYRHQVDGQIFLDAPLPVERTTWSRIKKLGS